MTQRSQYPSVLLLTGLSLLIAASMTSAQQFPLGVTGTPADQAADPALTNLPNPNPLVLTGWGRLPAGRTWGSTAGVDIGPDGHVWTYDRCGNVTLGASCDTIDPTERAGPSALRAPGRALGRSCAGRYAPINSLPL